MHTKVIYLTLILTIGFLITSCNTKEDDPNLINEWRLIAYLADPGDGSGQFVAVISDKTVSFYANGTVASNGSLCQMNSETTVASQGTYSESNQVIVPDDCGGGFFPITYDMQGENLVLNFPCIEPCREKYELVE